MADKSVALLKRAEKLLRQGNAEEAVKEYKKILEIKPDELEIRRIVGDIELRQNNNRGAIEQFEWIADYYLKEGSSAKAIAMFKRITRIDPNDESALFKLAELYTKQGLVMEANQIYLDIAEEAKKQNNQKKALEMYKKILEFNRTNIKMRLLLADNYLKEELENDAVNEYITAADIILNKKDFRRAEELLLTTLGKVKNLRIIEKLITLYAKSNEDEKAIKLINEQGLGLLKNIDLLKVVGELYLKKNMMTEAEKIFLKIADLDPGETEIIMRLGKVYIQREDYDRAFNLFLPTIEKNLKNKKYDEAGNLLRFIIASNNTYIPALTKLAEIFKLSRKTNNLIALDEALIPIYEEKGMKQELKRTLEELIQLSDTPFSYEEKLAKLTEFEAREAEEEKEKEREREFVNYNLLKAEESLRVRDVGKGIDILKKTRATLPKNIDVRKKLFEVYLEDEQIDLAVEEGKGLLELYKFLKLDREWEYVELLEKLSTLKPEDEKLASLYEKKKTGVDDISLDDFQEQIKEISVDDINKHGEEKMDDDEIMVLSQGDSLDTSSLPLEEDKPKSLSSVLSEIDFYVNDGYSGDAEKLIEQLKIKYPENKLLLAKIEKLEKAKKESHIAGESYSTGEEQEAPYEDDIAKEKEASKELSSAMSLIDSYVKNGYFEEAEQLVVQYGEKYPENKVLLSKSEALEKTKEMVTPLESQAGQKLAQLSIDEIMKSSVSTKGYTINEYYTIIGLKLDSLKIEDISFLSDLKDLTRVNLFNNKISDISPLKNLSNLEYLNLSDNQILDISIMKSLKNLKVLYLNNNQIPDIYPIIELKELTRLTLINNSISQLPIEIINLTMDIKWDDDDKKGIILSGNPLINPPEKIIKLGIESIKKYFLSSQYEGVIDFEEKAREYILKREYANGKKCLLKAIKLDPDQKQRLKEEFGFLYNLNNSFDEDQKILKRKQGQIEWRQQLWQILSDRNTFLLKNPNEESKKNLVAPSKQTQNDGKFEAPEVIYNGEKKTSEQKGEELEQLVMILFRDFFNSFRETCNIIPLKERQQSRGFQFGYDLEFICELKGSKKLKLFIECKNKSGNIRLKDIADKLDFIKADHHFSDVDHWILISPRATPSTDLDRTLKLWEKADEYPFNVQIWSSETHVADFFAVNHGIYDQFFKPLKGDIHPRDWDEKRKKENLEFWKKRLAPPLRLPKGWKGYLRDPNKLILRGDPSDLDNLYKHHVTLKCKDETGTELSQTLVEKIMEWLEKPFNTDPSLILLGEFGDGKTVFTYLLSRKLAEDFLSSPSTGWIPIRFSLKDFGLETVRDSRDFVRRRLEEFGADIDGWNTLKLSQFKMLAILDGFDEISKKLDHKTVLKNINDLIECYTNEFYKVKLLITSRKHFFENQQDKERLIMRIGNPQLLHLAPIDRRTTEDYLNQYAKEINSEEKFKQLKNYHDPIGLASKPLYLEMVKFSLKDLPEEDLNELALYETYTRQSLERKEDYLEDEKLETPPEMVVKNMLAILEEIAIKLHQSNEEFVYLSEFKGANELKKRLWKMIVYDEAIMEEVTRDDEKTRIAVRSLLRRIDPHEKSRSKKWPVDFCHRSMREYFVARGVCKMLKNNLKEAKQFLKNHSLNHEIVFFASEIMKKDDFEYEENLLNLIRTTKNLNNMEKLNIGYLGCNAVNLLYRYKGSLPGTDWSNLILDGANLSEADLSGKDFFNSSLQYANLDNVNFKNANFSNCNLTGVRLEETSEIESIGISPGRNVYVSYIDGVIREWVYEQVHTPYSKILYKDKKLRNIQIFALPGNDMTILAGQYLAYYDNVDNQLLRKSIFAIKFEVKLIKPSLDALLLLEMKDSQNILHLVNLKEQEVIKSIGIPLSIHYNHLDDRAFIIYDDKIGIQLIDLSSKKRENLPIQLQKGEYITCLNTHRCRHLPGQYRLGVGQKNGAIQIWDINLDEWEASLLFKEKFHEKTIKDIAFIDEERIIFGGFDKKLSLISINQKGELKCEPQELKIAMQCQGMQINGIVREEERSLLEKLIAKASS
jgi:Leucine-rich repeat (LRR) protein/Flp pilus assembly protein TadD